MLEGEEQEIYNLFENKMTRNFSTLVKGVDAQVQETQDIPNKINPKRLTPRQIIIKLKKVKDKNRTLKAVSFLQGSSHKNVNRFINKNFAGQKRLARNIQSDEKQEHTQQRYHLELKDI